MRVAWGGGTGAFGAGVAEHADNRNAMMKTSRNFFVIIFFS
jgi:hypothetical protein